MKTSVLFCVFILSFTTCYTQDSKIYTLRAENEVFAEENYIIFGQINASTGEYLATDSLVPNDALSLFSDFNGMSFVNPIDSMYYFLRKNDLYSFDISNGQFQEWTTIFEESDFMNIVSTGYDPLENVFYGLSRCTNSCESPNKLFKYDISEGVYEEIMEYSDEELGPNTISDSGTFNYIDRIYTVVTPFLRTTVSFDVDSGEILSEGLYCEVVFADDLWSSFYRESSNQVVATSFDTHNYYVLNPYDPLDCNLLVDIFPDISYQPTNFTFEQDLDLIYSTIDDELKIFNLTTLELNTVEIPSFLYSQHRHLEVLNPLTSGCMDEEACNYNSNAFIDDGSCEYQSCICYLGDANADGVVNLLDLTDISSNLGCEGDCFGDADCNNVVNVLDIVHVSTYFGTEYNLED